MQKLHKTVSIVYYLSDFVYRVFWNPVNYGQENNETYQSVPYEEHSSLVWAKAGQN